MLGEKKYSTFDVVALVLGTVAIQRWLAIRSTKAAAYYAARGDERQASRFEWLARHFARMSHMYGEVDREDAYGSPKAR